MKGIIKYTFANTISVSMKTSLYLVGRWAIEIFGILEMLENNIVCVSAHRNLTNTKG